MIQTTPAFDAANALLNKQLIFLVEIDNYAYPFSSLPVDGFNPWIVSMDALSQTVSDLDGGSDVGTFSFTVQDRDGAITATMPCFIFEGSTVTLKSGFEGMDPADYALIWTGTIDTVDSANANADYYVTATDKKAILSKTIFTLSDDGKTPTDSTHLRTVIGHPLDILVGILTDEFSMVANIDYDLDKILSYKNDLFNGALFSFKISKPPVALDFLEKEILVPLGGYLWANYLNKLTVNFFFPQDTTPVVALTRSNLAEIPQASTADLVNNIEFRFDDDGTGNATFLADAIIQDAASINKYGQFGGKTIESQGLKSGLQGYFLARQTANLIFNRYGNKNLCFDPNSASGGNGLLCFWDAVICEPGDFVSVTHSQVPDRKAGVMGISNKLFEVKDKTYNFSDGTVILSVIDVGVFGGTGTILIAPDSEADYTSASSGDKAKYMFLSSIHAFYSNGDKANLLG